MKNIMFQGTASSVGKSTLAAGLCRLLTRQGYRVVPFKSQNMSSLAITLANGEQLSTAQWLQALACRIEPNWRMNPILLKPQAETGSEVILAGRSQGRMSAREYYQKKPAYQTVVLEAYQSLADTSDVVVIEGAGSAAEINFRQGDFVNMGLAQLVRSPVILVGDIDRGGVFGALYGTLKLLSAEDQALIKGFIINKFRGDVSLLEPAIEEFAAQLGVPCLGIVPYYPHNLPEEDSLSEAKAESDQSLDQSLDELADHLAAHLDIAQLKDIIGLC